MLVLSRREVDAVLFPGPGITIEILSINGQSVRLGIDAPIEIKILRGELELDDQNRKVLIKNARSLLLSAAKIRHNNFS